MNNPKRGDPRGFFFGFYISHFAFCICAAGAFAASKAATLPAIRVDQIGYGTGAAKIAVVVADAKAFSVHRVTDGGKVFEGELADPAFDPLSGDTVRLADFSGLAEAGTFEIRAGDARSLPFRIDANPHADLLRLTMRSYYGQRCGTAVDLGGGYAHPACHVKGRFHRSSGREGVGGPRGGWHDAGDYGRYVVNSGITVGTLLWAFELYPAALADLELTIPESGNQVPDLLDEVRWNLEWMLAMQDEDGGAWAKETSARFPGFVAPEDDPSTVYVMGSGKPPWKSSCATGELAAAAAIAARVYEPYDEDLAARAADAASRAWEWLEAHPNETFRNPSGVETGEYGDANCLDERLWAAAEMWRSTRDRRAHAFFLARSEAAIRAIGSDDPQNWRNVGALAAWAYALAPEGDEGLRKAIAARTIAAADGIADRARRNPWRIPLVEANYVWGSNGVAANYGMQLLVAHAIRPDPAYRDAAAEIVHYLLGRNAVAISFVTGAGAHSVLHPHHRPSAADAIEAPWPGLLAGGPDRQRRDPLLRGLPRETPPAKSYRDAQGSFASNEVAINWNAPLVFVLAGLQGE